MTDALLRDARDQAVAKCRSCKHGEYRPFQPGRINPRVAFDVEAIKCGEGIFALRGPTRWPTRKPYFYQATDTLWYWTGYLARADSRVRETILTCDFWEAR